MPSPTPPLSHDDTSLDDTPSNSTANGEPPFTQQIERELARERAALHAILKEPLPEMVPVYDRNLFATGFLVILTIIFVFLGIVEINGLIHYDYRKLDGPAMFTLASLFGLAGLFFYRPYRVFRNWRKPLFTLSLAGVQFRGGETVLPWKQVHNYQVHITTYYFIPITARVDFDLAANEPVEWPLKKPAGVKYRPKKALIRARGVGFSPQSRKVSALIGQYRMQSHALDRLEILGN